MKKDLTGMKRGSITVIRRGPNDKHGGARWWVTNSLNVNPLEEYLMERRSLWRKCTGRRPKNGCGFQKKYPAIYRSVINHFKWIYNPHDPERYHGYKGMPAHQSWNPKKGPKAVVKAVTDILSEIGDKPSKKHILHIMDKRIGFRPGNLMWVPSIEHKRMELLNILIKENAMLKKRLSKYEF